MKLYQSKKVNRGIKKRIKRKIILIGCEGNNKTERLYFTSFNKVQKEYVIKTSYGNDTDLVGILNNIKTSEKVLGFDSLIDKSFVIFDIDNDFSKILILEKIRNKKEYKNIGFIPSNPCFELWYLLHFVYTTKSYNSNKELLNELCKYIKDYDKTKDYFDSLFPYLETAIKNNKKLVKYTIEISKMEFLKNSFTSIVEIVEPIYRSISW